MITNIEQVLHILHDGNLVEIRALGLEGRHGSVWGGYFTDYQKAAAAVTECEAARASGVYVTLNNLHQGLWARSPNILTKQPVHTTKDKEVLSPRWVLIDVDPVRPAGISSTDQELEWARETRNDVAWWLHESFPGRTLVLACSGNGYHALLRQKMSPADQKDLVITATRLFGSDRVDIDKSVNNLSRITKMYGTVARKGYSTPDRPRS